MFNIYEFTVLRAFEGRERGEKLAQIHCVVGVLLDSSFGNISSLRSVLQAELVNENQMLMKIFGREEDGLYSATNTIDSRTMSTVALSAHLSGYATALIPILAFRPSEQGLVLKVPYRLSNVISDMRGFDRLLTEFKAVLVSDGHRKSALTTVSGSALSPP